jgi:hypothetical protein
MQFQFSKDLQHPNMEYDAELHKRLSGSIKIRVHGAQMCPYHNQPAAAAARITRKGLTIIRIC